MNSKLSRTKFSPGKLSFGWICFGIAALSIVVAYAVTCAKNPHVHYEIFSLAGTQLANGINPYGTSLNNAGGFQTLWLYSPFTALLFWPLSVFSDRLGQAVYIGLSLLLFVWSLKFWLSKLQARPRLQNFGFPFLVLSSEVVGAIQAAKFEILIAAGFFWTLGHLEALEKKTKDSSAKVQKPTVSWAIVGICMGLLLNTKFVSLPFLGLVWIFLLQKKISLVLTFVGFGALGVLTSIALPFAFWDFSLLLQSMTTWHTSLSAASLATWTTYQHLGVNLRNLLGWPEQLSTFYAVSSVIALWCIRSVWKNPSPATVGVLACAYVCVCLPMSQSSGYVLASPAVLYLWMHLQAKSSPAKDARTKSWPLKSLLPFGVLSIHWFSTSLVYSDLVPKALQRMAWDQCWKPLSLTALMLYWMLQTERNGKPRSALDQSSSIT